MFINFSAVRNFNNVSERFESMTVRISQIVRGSFECGCVCVMRCAQNISNTLRLLAAQKRPCYFFLCAVLPRRISSLHSSRACCAMISRHVALEIYQICCKQARTLHSHSVFFYSSHPLGVDLFLLLTGIVVSTEIIKSKNLIRKTLYFRRIIT